MPPFPSGNAYLGDSTRHTRFQTLSSLLISYCHSGLPRCHAETHWSSFPPLLFHSISFLPLGVEFPPLTELARLSLSSISHTPFTAPTGSGSYQTPTSYQRSHGLFSILSCWYSLWKLPICFPMIRESLLTLHKSLLSPQPSIKSIQYISIHYQQTTEPKFSYSFISYSN